MSMECKDVVAAFFTFTINATEENKETAESAYPTVYPCPPNFKLNNWNAVEVPVTYKLLEKYKTLVP